MAGDPAMFRAAFPLPPGARLPHPVQLAELGTVLCLSRSALGGDLEGWARAALVRSQLHVDSDGLRESLWFFDQQGQCCWRIYLLPESDFLAWDRLAGGLPTLGEPEAESGVGERLWRRLGSRLRGGAWRMSVLRLHAAGRRGDELAASLAAVSAPGTALLRRIAHDEGLELNCASLDCCCARAQRTGGGQGGTPVVV
jgi:hypothetical protein